MTDAALDAAGLAALEAEWVQWAEEIGIDMPHMWEKQRLFPRGHRLRHPVWRVLHDLQTAARDIVATAEREASPEPRAAPESRRIIRNSARCLSCGDEVESRHRHDYVTCKCGSVSVDGGLDYLKRAGVLSSVHETSVFAEAGDVQP